LNPQDTRATGDKTRKLFTGIIQEVATVIAVEARGEAAVLCLELGGLATEVNPGDSVAVDGVCLTATQVRDGMVDFDLSAQTLAMSTMGRLRGRSRVNVELAMRPTSRFGGHFVAGHVDGRGTIIENKQMPGQWRLAVGVSPHLAGQMIPKGSVAVDGISLTVADLRADAFTVSIIPATLRETTLRDKRPGDQVNIECDMIGKWVKKLLQGGPQPSEPDMTLERLKEEGF